MLVLHEEFDWKLRQERPYTWAPESFADFFTKNARSRVLQGGFLTAWRFNKISHQTKRFRNSSLATNLEQPENAPISFWRRQARVPTVTTSTKTMLSENLRLPAPPNLRAGCFVGRIRWAPPTARIPIACTLRVGMQQTAKGTRICTTKRFFAPSRIGTPSSLKKGTSSLKQGRAA